MDPIITSALMTFGAGFTGAAFAKAQGPGQALDDIMTIVGFDKLHEIAEKKRAKRDINLQQYKESIAQKVFAIPEENIQEPPLSIVGPALDASKYYIEEDDLREMFANLISSSMDNRKDSVVHPSYVEIIKQLSRHDALILRELVNINLTDTTFYPVLQGLIRMREKHEKGDLFRTYIPIIAIFNENRDYKRNATSINNLVRLGIMNISFDKEINQSMYNIYKEDINFAEEMESLCQKIEASNPNETLSYQHGNIILTTFGMNFINCCVQNNHSSFSFN